jgi:hypothetical protein
MQRPVISYDDITLPYHQSDSPSRPAANNSPAGPSQSKKRKWSNQQSGQSHRSKNKAANGVPKEDWVANEEEEEDEDADSRYLTQEDEDADSRYLTQEEIWDDSALINAWDAAMEEYEVRIAALATIILDSLNLILNRP